MKRIFIIVLMLLLGACKQIEKSNLDNKFENQFIVELQVKVPKDDKFELFYRDVDEDFSTERSIKVAVGGLEVFQIITFAFDIQEYPKYVRIDFGNNGNQAEMTFGHLAFRYNDAVYMFSKEEIKKFFRPNPGLDFDFKNSKVLTKKVNGKYDPYLSSFNITAFVNKVISF